MFCISYNKGALKTKAVILLGVNFISVALKHKQKIIIPLAKANCTILLSINFIATVTVKYKDDK